MSEKMGVISNSVLNRLQEIRKFIKAMNCCPLCSEPLSLIHEVNSEDHKILETAHCTKCQMDVRRKKHRSH